MNAGPHTPCDAEGNYITEANERRIIEWWHSGSSPAIIGKGKKLSTETINFILQRHGFNPKTPPDKR